MGDVTDKVKFENWLLYGLTRPESWLTHVKALHLDYKKAEAELARVTAEAAVMREALESISDPPEGVYSTDWQAERAREALSSTSAGAGLLEAARELPILRKRLEAAEKVCNFWGAWNLGADVSAELNATFKAWRRVKEETK